MKFRYVETSFLDLPPDQRWLVACILLIVCIVLVVLETKKKTSTTIELNMWNQWREYDGFFGNSIDNEHDNVKQFK